MSAFRILAAPVELWLSWHQREHAFLALFACVLLSDAIDGPIARRSGRVTPFGATLDSWGDFAMFLSLPFCAWWLWPDMVRRESLFIILAVSSYVVPTVIGVLRFGRLTSYHTWLAKLSAVLMGLSVLVMVLARWPWPFRFAVPVFVMSALEDIAITFILPRWSPDVPTLLHALRFRRAAAAQGL